MKRFFNLMVCLCACLCMSAEIKYVFYFIGDGMGPNQVLATEMYLAELDGHIGRNKLHMTQLPYSGQAATFSKSNGITDSAAAGTALATGSKTNNGTLGLNAEGDTLTSIAEQLKAQGWGVGLLTTVAIDHATPAAFYANVLKRDDYYNIGLQLVKTDFDFFGGAGFHRPRPRTGEWDNLYDLAEQESYTIASGLSMGEQKMGEAKKMILVQATDAIDRRKEGSNFPYCIDDRADSSRLNMLTDFAIRFLGQKNERFFLMVEGGMIDYACHGRDAAASIQETIDFDDAIGVALEFYKQHPDETLIVVTADHETGGMGLGNSHYTLDLQVLQHQHCSAWVLSDEISKLYDKGKRKPKWQEVRDILEKQLDFYGSVSISAEEDAALQTAFKKTLKRGGRGAIKTMYKNINSLSGDALALLNRKAQLGWTSYSHTAAAVPVFAIGQGAEQFTGWMDNTELVPKIMRIVEGK
ncbi:MAG: alkaline phosphatase [Paludibacteraceae bacterium]|nr:alkaline phosphatase [Paludibacteraceae bacterium]